MNDLRIAGWSGILFSVLSVIVIRCSPLRSHLRSAPAEQRSECKCTLGASVRAVAVPAGLDDRAVRRFLLFACHERRPWALLERSP